MPDTGSTAHRRWRDIALLAGLFGFVIVGLAGFEGLHYHMTPELVDRAWANLFVKDEVIVK